jgi:hypothetical protein
VEERLEKAQDDVKTGIETIIQRGSVVLEKKEDDIGGHSEASHSNELGKSYSIQMTNMYLQLIPCDLFTDRNI